MEAKKTTIMIKSSTQRHFDFMILLMCGFFSVVFASETYNAWMESRVINYAVAEDAFRTLFGVALGMFRGMSPEDKDTNKDDG